MARTNDFIKSYPDDALLEEIRRVAGLVDKPVLTQPDFKKHSGISADIIRRRFGKWRTALEKAGLGHMFSGASEENLRFVQGWHSDEWLLEELRRVAGLVDKPVLMQTDFQQYSSVVPDLFRERFGSWRAAMERVGLGQMICRPSEDMLLEEVRRVAELVGKQVLMAKDFAKHSRFTAEALQARFGPWRVVLERAGIGHMFSRASRENGRVSRGGNSDEELLEEVRRVAGVVGTAALTVDLFIEHSSFSSKSLLYQFGSWSAVLERAGIGHMHHSAVKGFRNLYSDETLIEELRRVAKLVDRPVLTQDDFKKYAEPGVDTCTKRFGGWRAALKRAGLEHMFARSGSPGARANRLRWSDEALLEEVRRVAAIVGKPVLTIEDFEKHARCRGVTLRKRIGLWRVVLERAGIGNMYGAGAPPAEGRRYSDEELLEEVRRVARLVGKPVLTYEDFDANSSQHSGSIKRRFGDWRVVLERAGIGHMYSGRAVSDRMRRKDKRRLSDA